MYWTIILSVRMCHDLLIALSVGLLSILIYFVRNKILLLRYNVMRSFVTKIHTQAILIRSFEYFQVGLQVYLLVNQIGLVSLHSLQSLLISQTLAKVIFLSSDCTFA